MKLRAARCYPESLLFLLDPDRNLAFDIISITPLNFLLILGYTRNNRQPFKGGNCTLLESGNFRKVKAGNKVG